MSEVERPYEIKECLSDGTYAVLFDGVNIVAEDLTREEAKALASQRNQEFAETQERKLNLEDADN